MLVACQWSRMLTWFPIISISPFFLGAVFYMQWLRSVPNLITCESELHSWVSRMACSILSPIDKGIVATNMLFTAEKKVLPVNIPRYLARSHMFTCMPMRGPCESPGSSIEHACYQRSARSGFPSLSSHSSSSTSSTLAWTARQRIWDASLLTVCHIMISLVRAAALDSCCLPVPSPTKYVPSLAPHSKRSWDSPLWKSLSHSV